MLREDEKVFLEGEAQAVNILLQYLNSGDHSKETTSKQRKDLEKYLNMLDDMVDDSKQAAIDDLESDTALSRSTRASDRRFRRVSSKWTVDSSSGRFVTMEDF